MELTRAVLAFLALAALALLVPAVPSAQAQAPRAGAEAAAEADEALAALFAADEETEARLDPLGALYRGELPDPAMLRLLYTDALDRLRRDSAEEILHRLSRIDPAALGPKARIAHDAFVWRKRQQIDWLRPEARAAAAVRPFTHFGGIHVEFPALMARGGPFPYATEADYRQALDAQRAFAAVLGNARLRFAEGLSAGMVESRLTVRNMIAQIDAILAKPVTGSPFYDPVTRFPEGIAPPARAALRTAYAEAIAADIYPAYRGMRDFLEREYLPHAREAPGLGAMPGGAEHYRRLIARETTLALDAAQVHALGLAEVARLRAEMDTLRQKIGFAGPLDAFFEHVRNDPRFHPRDAQQLADGFAAIGKTVDERIPRLFSTVPKTPLVIAPFPAFRERFEPAASYYQGAAEEMRPGTFYYNTWDLPARFLTGMTTLYLHEAVPGHHFQISLAQENEELPAFLRFGGNSAFVEGWALYAETLGFEMGLYDDPLQHWGTLDDEMLRAMRLVVDTGLHAKGWSQAQAVDYMLANSGMSRADAQQEVERYIAIPGQALSYKIGALAIQDLRRKAETALGERFDIRAFHDQVLDTGAVPLPVLDAKVSGWIAAQLGER